MPREAARCRRGSARELNLFGVVADSIVGGGNDTSSEHSDVILLLRLALLSIEKDGVMSSFPFKLLIIAGLSVTNGAKWVFR